MPAGSWQFGAALDGTWDESYGDDGGNVSFGLAEPGVVTFTYDSLTHVVTHDAGGGGGGGGGGELDPAVLDLARPGLREDLTDEVFCFVLPDRFHDADPGNNTGGLEGDRLVTGLDTTDEGFFHEELEALIDEAHSRDMNVFFDIITNHTADVIDYQEGVYDYIAKASKPDRDADGDAFDDRDFAGTGTIPAPDAGTSFPHTPVVPEGAPVKTPGWLNDPTMYHNRGNSSFAGESSVQGDFFGLDDLFTERPEVDAGLVLSPVQAGGADPVVKGATFAGGTFTVPARTTAVFVEPTAPEPVSVELRLRGGGKPAVVNPRSRGELSVTVLSQPGFSPVADLVVSSLRFGVTGQEDSITGCVAGPDVDRDGVADLVCTATVRGTGIRHGDQQLLLTGVTVAGAPVDGSVEVRTVPPSGPGY